MNTEPITPEVEIKSKKQVLNALISRPSKYHVKVVNNTELPEALKDKEEITFEVKPPVLSTLERIGVIALGIPDEVFSEDSKNVKYLRYLKEMCEMIAIFSHGYSKKEMPLWYVPFLLDNLTPEEMAFMLHESMAKCKTDFFLPCIQIVKHLNPMMMMKVEKVKES
jgi:hypothetical protein